jgi:hypothetical protein
MNNYTFSGDLVALPLQLPQQNPTLTVFLAGLPEIGHLVKSPFAFKASLGSLTTFLAQLPQHTPTSTVWSALTALPEIGHLSLTGPGAFFAAKEKATQIASAETIASIFFIMWNPFV